jgi:hypothetical protein
MRWMSCHSSSTGPAAVADATSGGATVFEKRYGRDFCLSTSMTSARPTVNPQDQGLVEHARHVIECHLIQETQEGGGIFMK